VAHALNIPQFTSILVGIALLPACTTSRAVQTWRDGWQAENRGDTGKAARLYAEAGSRDGRQIGARLDRIRLLARGPEGQDEARELLDKLTKSEGSEPRVAAFAAVWALWKGDAALASQRLAAARPPRPEDDDDTHQALASARLALLSAQGKWQQAWPLAEAATPTHATALRFATIAWNAGHPEAAPYFLTQAPATPATALLGALVAARAGKWPEVLTRLQALEGADVTTLVLTLRARAALALGDAAKASGLAGEAARRDPGDPEVTELWAVTLLSAGQAGTARDLLSGLTARGAGWTAWHHLGLAMLRLGDPAAATIAFQGAAQRCPTCAGAVRNAAVLQKLGIGP
jgi:hypothetical protein